MRKTSCLDKNDFNIEINFQKNLSFNVYEILAKMTMKMTPTEFALKCDYIQTYSNCNFECDDKIEVHLCTSLCMSLSSLKSM